MRNENGNDPRTMLVLWPDGPRWVNAETIVGWARDSWCDHADRRICCACGQDVLVESEHCEHLADDRPEYDDGTPEPRSLEEAVAWLCDTGEVTFAGRVRAP